MSKLNLGDLIGQPYGKHQHYTVSLFFFNSQTNPLKQHIVYMFLFLFLFSSMECQLQLGSGVLFQMKALPC